MVKRERGGVVNTKIFYNRYVLQQNVVKHTKNFQLIESREDIIRRKIAIRGKRIRVLKRWGKRTGRINRLEDRSKILGKEGRQFQRQGSKYLEEDNTSHQGLGVRLLSATDSDLIRIGKDKIKKTTKGVMDVIALEKNEGMRRVDRNNFINQRYMAFIRLQRRVWRDRLRLDQIAISTPPPREKVLVALFLYSLNTEKLEKPNSEMFNVILAAWQKVQLEVVKREYESKYEQHANWQMKEGEYPSMLKYSEGKGILVCSLLTMDDENGSSNVFNIFLTSIVHIIQKYFDGQQHYDISYKFNTSCIKETQCEDTAMFCNLTLLRCQCAV
ncbi:hypothetical protein QTP88_013463 [Uroleucon formosanum]